MTGSPRSTPAAGRLAAAVLGAARAIVAACVLADAEDVTFTADDVVRRVDADPDARIVLDAAVTAGVWRWEETARPVDGARARRVARAAEIDEAISDLRLAGELIADGPGRLALPGWGPATQRAVRALRDAPPGTALWEAEVARMPSADLGGAAPAWLRGLPATPELEGCARAVLACDADRQGIRDALLTAAARLARLLDRGDDAAADGLTQECARLGEALARTDALAASRWAAGVALASRARPSAPGGPRAVTADAAPGRADPGAEDPAAGAA